MPYLPNAITLLRVAVLPFLVSFVLFGQLFLADALFLVAIGSDLADGYLARKMCVCSKLGAIFDSAVDFVFAGGMFLYFVLAGIYPSWVFFLILAMFLQYLSTSRLMKVSFDPIGKYYGSILYGAIGLTLLFRGQGAERIILYSLVSASIFTLSSRIAYLIKKCKRWKSLKVDSAKCKQKRVTESL